MLYGSRICLVESDKCCFGKVPKKNICGLYFNVRRKFYAKSYSINDGPMYVRAC